MPHTFSNGDTRRQLLARSRHIVMKHFSKWTPSQKIRAEILFEQYPDLKQAYDVSMELTQIYNKITDKGVALAALARWYDRVERLNCKFFNSVIQTMQNNYGTIINYFENRSTNASAESFNAKVKAFRAQFRGVRDIPFFISLVSTKNSNMFFEIFDN
jgi:transposase